MIDLLQGGDGRFTRLRESFAAQLSADEIIVSPGVPNAYWAKIAANVGAGAICATGAGITNHSVAWPDLGLLTMTEVLEATARIIDAVDVPIVADIDTGYGGYVNVVRTVHSFERAGAAAVIIEDQVTPKRCGHFAGKAVVPPEEMVEKIVAAISARTDPAMTIIARTDSLQVEGLPGALERARLYRAAGADAIFVEAPRTEDEIAAIPEAVDAPCIINMVEGGVTPQLPAEELQRLGFGMVIHANLALRIAAAAVENAFRTLLAEGGSAGLLPQMYTWQQRQSVVGLDRWFEFDAEIAQRAKAVFEAHRAPASDRSG